MSHRESKILWLRDTLDQLQNSQQELQWTDDPDTIRVLTESMIRDLASCQRVCEEINRRARVRQLV
jgi:hypothetical protein